MKIENKEQYLELFPTLEHWTAFHELTEMKKSMERTCLARATSRIRRHFSERPSEGWECGIAPSSDRDVDTIWYLNDYGPTSLHLMYGWNYELQLRPANWGFYQSMDVSQFDAVKSGFARIDRVMQGGSIFMENRNFSFGLPNDGHLSPLELVWAAAYYEDEFVKQAIEKIERFTTDPAITAAIRELNRIATV
jgi:hypothetical protein